MNWLDKLKAEVEIKVRYEREVESQRQAAYLAEEKAKFAKFPGICASLSEPIESVLTDLKHEGLVVDGPTTGWYLGPSFEARRHWIIRFSHHHLATSDGDYDHDVYNAYVMKWTVRTPDSSKAAGLSCNVYVSVDADTQQPFFILFNVWRLHEATVGTSAQELRNALSPFLENYFRSIA